MAQENNPWYVEPLGGFGSSIAKNLGGVADLYIQKQEIQADQELRSQAANVLATKDPQKIAAFSMRNPKFAEKMTEAYDREASISLADTKAGIQEIIARPENAMNILRERAQTLVDNGGDAHDTLQDIAELDQNPEAYLKGLENEYALLDPNGYMAYRKATEAKEGTNGYANVERDAAGVLWGLNKATNTFEKVPAKEGFAAAIDPDALKNQMDKEKSTFDRSKKLRDEYNSASSEYFKVRDAYGRVQASVTDPDAAGDIALIFNYMKMLDPGSVVREGEFATAQNSGGVQDTVINAYNKALSGERLNPDQRKMFENRAKKLFSTAQVQDKKNRANILKVGNAYGLKEKDLFGVGQDQSPPGEQQGNAPQSAIDYLKSNPQFAEQFKQKYGYLPEGS